jgi:hypothetical protein
MDQNEQTQSAFSAPNRRDAYTQARAATPEQKGLSYTDLLFDNIFGLDNEYESTGETIKKALVEDPYGTVKGMATSAYEGAVDLARNPYAVLGRAVEDTAGSLNRVATEDLDEKLKRMYGVSYEEATPEQVTKAREVVASDVMTAAELIPGAGIAAKGAKLAAKGAVNALPEAAQAARKFIADESGSLPLGKSVPASRQKIPRFLGGRKQEVSPQATFGTKRLRDIFEEDEADIDALMQADLSIEDPNDIGYARGMDMNTLAQIKLGKVSVEDALDDLGTDPNDAAVNYINSRMQRLDNDPEFNDYLNLLKTDPTFDPYIKDSFDPTFAGPTVFRSAIPEVAALINFPKNGIEGSQLIAELQKNPSLRKSELDTVLEEFDPKTRYSKEEALDLINKNTWTVTVKKIEEDGFVHYQRQDELLDPELEYFEFTVNAKRPNMFKAKYQHFDDASTLAHTRGSFRSDAKNGYDYTLIEEKQTDLLQKGFAEPRKGEKKVTPSEAVDSLFKELPENSGLDDNDKELLKIFGEDKNAEFYSPNSYLDFIKKVGAENLAPGKTPDQIIKMLNPKSILGASVSDNLLSLYANFKSGTDVGSITPSSSEAWDYKDGLIDTYYSAVKDKIKFGKAAISAPPIKKLEESFKITMDALIAESAARGITRIVMPPFERIADKRFNKDTDPEGYAQAIDPKNSMYKTYVTSFKKYIKDAEEEFGRGNFNARLKDLDYSDPDYLPTTGTEIDFTGLFNSGYDFSRPAMAEGGMVEEEQMNRLMQQGGMTDDGLTEEPVTGNNIPPGALASEVRDDVDTKLSGGEYVVPADVLRYYGVRFFEDLRSQAKQGMMEMESAGRIGGVPVDPRGVPMQGQDEELTPEEEQMLAQAMSSSSGMAEGGDVFNREDFTMPTYDTSPIDSRLYFNPSTGKKMTISFMAGQALGAGIPAGFVPWTQALQDTYNATKAEAPKPRSNNNDRNNGGNQPEPANYNDWADENFNAITSNPYDFGMNALKTPDNSTGLAGGLIGIITGRDKDIQNIANANAALKLMEAKGLTGSEQYKTLTESVKSYISQISPLEQGLVLTKVAGTGNGYLKAIEEKEKQSPAATPPAPKPSTGASSSTSTGGDNKKDDNNDNTPSPPPARPAPAAPRLDSTGGGFTGSGYRPPVAPRGPSLGGGVDGPRPTPAPTPTVPQGGRAGFEEGGLVTKPKKTRAKTKGLAGKQ